MLLGAGLALAQTGGDKSGTELNPQPLPPGHRAPANAKPMVKKGHHKSGKKNKKGSSSSTTSTTPK
jgi:hypothetical protein